MPSLVSFGGESGFNVVDDDDIESSMSEAVEGVGELALISGDALRFLDRIFCVIRVWENGRVRVDNGLE